MMKPHSCKPSSATSTQLSMHKHSREISKLQPKIRIIHIYAPEVIKTEPANFRELVQRLTGKPAEMMKSNRNSTTCSTTRSPPTKNIMSFYREPSCSTIEMHDAFANLQNGIKKSSREVTEIPETSHCILPS
uniref:VQ domain-containing protein n=1 Tax=Quercus lobata TaxID=97700 RepID=A0A7N2LD95_QUELO